jgi:hypothetical protein
VWVDDGQTIGSDFASGEVDHWWRKIVVLVWRRVRFDPGKPPSATSLLWLLRLDPRHEAIGTSVTHGQCFGGLCVIGLTGADALNRLCPSGRRVRQSAAPHELDAYTDG